MPMLPLPRKAAVVLAVVGHLPRSIQAYPQGCNTHCTTYSCTESESESGGSEPPQASQLPRFTSSFDPFGSLDALALVQPRPRDPGSFRLALQASMLTPIHSNMCYTCATDACNATPVCFKLVGTRSPPIGTVKRRALADFLPINTRSTLGFDPGSHGTLASSLSTKATGEVKALTVPGRVA